MKKFCKILFIIGIFLIIGMKTSYGRTPGYDIYGNVGFYSNWEVSFDSFIGKQINNWEDSSESWPLYVRI